MTGTVPCEARWCVGRNPHAAAHERLAHLHEERELTNIRGQIEEVQGRIQYLERRTATSEIVLHLEPLAAAPVKEPWSASSVAARAWDASLGVLQAAATATISVVVFCWWLVPPAAVGLLLWRRGRTAGASG